MLSVERSTISRNLALMQSNGWIAASETSPSGRSMSVAITELGTDKLASARAAWEQAQAYAVARLGTDATTSIDSWIDALNASTTSEAAS